MIITNPDGTKVSSENINRDGIPMFKCPKCGCLYFSFDDIKSFHEKGVDVKTICNECNSELEMISNPNSKNE